MNYIPRLAQDRGTETWLVTRCQDVNQVFPLPLTFYCLKKFGYSQPGVDDKSACCHEPRASLGNETWPKLRNHAWPGVVIKDSYHGWAITNLQDWPKVLQSWPKLGPILAPPYYPVCVVAWSSEI
ncbi:hypothetical protein WA026_006645 [Henosepilachna vigintioctopunctata]|uniref:Uncharacterized protein n=1 Tax=Henosepilachna vigintioctopunctata TaxID=420089 RepID=A0AAW1UAL3_9CUCU